MDSKEFERFMESRSPLLLTTRQAGAYLGVGEDRIREFVHNKYFPLKVVNLPNAAYPLYRIQDLEEYVEAFTTKGGIQDDQ